MWDNPVVAKEFLLIARSRRGFVLRTSAAIACVAAIGTIVGGLRQRPASAFGVQDATALFQGISWAAIGWQWTMIAVLAPAYLALTISTERNRNTWESLLACGLSNRRILSGKLFANVFWIFLYAHIPLPLLIFCSLFGGTSLTFLILNSLYLFTSSIFLGSFCIIVSLLAASSVAALVISGWFASLWWLPTALFFDVTMIQNLANTPFFRILTWPSPIHVAVAAFQRGVGFENIVGSLIWSVFIQLVLSACFLAAAIRRVRTRLARTAGIAVATDPVEPGRFLQKRIHGIGALIGHAAPARRRPCGNFPLIWKESRIGLGKTRTPTALIPLIVILFIFWRLGFLGLNAWLEMQMYGTDMYELIQTNRFDRFRARNVFHQGVAETTRLFFIFLSIVILVRGATSITAERERETWISLLATPLTAGAILRGKILGALSGGRPILAAIMAIWTADLIFGGLHPYGFALGLIPIICKSVFFATLGVVCSLYVRSNFQAITLTALALPIVYAFANLGGYPNPYAILAYIDKPHLMMRVFDIPLVNFFQIHAALGRLPEFAVEASIRSEITHHVVTSMLFLIFTGLFALPAVFPIGIAREILRAPRNPNKPAAPAQPTRTGATLSTTMVFPTAKPRSGGR